MTGGIIVNPYRFMPTTPPVNTVAPSITGDLYNGGILTGNVGAWSGSPTSYAAQWRYNGVDIPGETNMTYTANATTGLGGITFYVVALNSSGSGNAVSAVKDEFKLTDVAPMAGWYNITDESSLTIVPTDLITQVNDLSGNARHGVATTTQRPTYNARTLNGFKIADFNGSSNKFVIPVAVLGVNQPALSIAAFYVPDVATTSLAVISNDGGSNGARSRITNQAQNFGAAEVTRGSVATGSGIAHLGRTPNAGSVASRMKINADAEVTSATNNRSTATTANASIGSFGTTGSWFDGGIAEIGVWQTELSAAQANRVMRARCGKFGITWSDVS